MNIVFGMLMVVGGSIIGLQSIEINTVMSIICLVVVLFGVRTVISA